MFNRSHSGDDHNELIEARTGELEQILSAVSCGQNVLIVGASGAGKSTIMERCAEEIPGAFGSSPISIGLLFYDPQELNRELESELRKFDYPTIDGRVIVYIDEMDHMLLGGDRDELAMNEFLLSRSDEFIFVVAIHPPNMVSSPLLDRFDEVVLLAGSFKKVRR